jgi:hypothetical protein
LWIWLRVERYLILYSQHPKHLHLLLYSRRVL